MVSYLVIMGYMTAWLQYRRYIYLFVFCLHLPNLYWIWLQICLCLQHTPLWTLWWGDRENCHFWLTFKMCIHRMLVENTVCADAVMEVKRSLEALSIPMCSYALMEYISEGTQEEVLLCCKSLWLWCDLVPKIIKAMQQFYKCNLFVNKPQKKFHSYYE